MTDSQVRKLVPTYDGLDSEKKALLAGALLASCDPSIDNLQKFWSELGEEVRPELEGRVCDGELQPNTRAD